VAGCGLCGLTVPKLSKFSNDCAFTVLFGGGGLFGIRAGLPATNGIGDERPEVVLAAVGAAGGTLELEGSRERGRIFAKSASRSLLDIFSR
jgi:hypothetical protein